MCEHTWLSCLRLCSWLHSRSHRRPQMHHTIDCAANLRGTSTHHEINKQSTINAYFFANNCDRLFLGILMQSIKLLAAYDSAATSTKQRLPRSTVGRKIVFFVDPGHGASDSRWRQAVGRGDQCGGGGDRAGAAVVGTLECCFAHALASQLSRCARPWIVYVCSASVAQSDDVGRLVSPLADVSVFELMHFN